MGSAPTVLAVRNVSLGTTNAQDQILLIANAMTESLYADSVAPVQPACPAVRCQWPLYKSVALCSVCEDALDDIVVEPEHDAALQAYTNNDFWSEYQFSDLDLD